MAEKCFVGGMQQISNDRMSDTERRIHDIIRSSPLNGNDENCGLLLLCPKGSVEHGIISCRICVAKYIAQEMKT